MLWIWVNYVYLFILSVCFSLGVFVFCMGVFVFCMLFLCGHLILFILISFILSVLLGGGSGGGEGGGGVIMILFKL